MVSQYFDAQETLGKEVISLTGFFMLYQTDVRTKRYVVAALIYDSVEYRVNFCCKVTFIDSNVLLHITLDDGVDDVDEPLPAPTLSSATRPP